MIKLLRNALAEGHVFQTANGGKIKWQYLVELHELQNNDGLWLGTEVKMAHMQWEKQKMKVNLATQLLSSSVAGALLYGYKNLRLPQFNGYEETVHFLKTVDDVFDILNSRNPLTKGYKASIMPHIKECAETSQQCRTVPFTTPGWW